LNVPLPPFDPITLTIARKAIIMDIL